MADATAADVLERRALYSVEQGDCEDFLINLPADSVDLCLFSPPYDLARTYSIGFNKSSEVWALWMSAVIQRALRVSPICVCVCQGQTRDHAWTGSPVLLMADLLHAGVTLRRPVIYRRDSIPGSGGRDYLRQSWEFAIVATRGGPLPWADPTACGAPPKWGPGGQMSNRMRDGSRCNARAGDVRPLVSFLSEYVNATKADPREVLQDLRRAVGEKAVAGWTARIAEGLRHAQLLQPPLCGSGPGEAFGGCPGQRSGVEAGAEDHREDGMLGLRSNRELERPSQGPRPEEQHVGEQASAVRVLPPEAAPRLTALSDLWQEKSVQELLRQALDAHPAAWRSADAKGEPASSADLRSLTADDAPCLPMPGLEAPPPKEPPALRCATGGRRRADGKNPGGERRDGKQAGGLMPAIANPGDVVSHTYTQAEVDALLAAYRGADVVDCGAVGGGRMGSKLAHANEAPFPETLAAFFVRTFAPPGGVVLDCFCGSGTTLAVAVQWGRRAIGCDLRGPEQPDPKHDMVSLSRRRLAGVVPPLPVQPDPPPEPFPEPEPAPSCLHDRTLFDAPAPPPPEEPDDAR